MNIKILINIPQNICITIYISTCQYTKFKCTSFFKYGVHSYDDAGKMSGRYMGIKYNNLEANKFSILQDFLRHYQNRTSFKIHLWYKMGETYDGNNSSFEILEILVYVDEDQSQKWYTLTEERTMICLYAEYFVICRNVGMLLRIFLTSMFIFFK